MNRFSFFLCFCLLSFHADGAEKEIKFANRLPETDAKNLVPNSSFELGENGWSTYGKSVGWGYPSNFHGLIEQGGTHGKQFLRVPMGAKKTPVTYYDYPKGEMRRELRPLAANIGWIEVKPGELYTLSCDMRASEDGVRGFLGVREENPERSPRSKELPGIFKEGPTDPILSGKQITLGKEWKRYSVSFKPQCRFLFVTVGPDLEKETEVNIDVDAIQLEKGKKATAFRPRQDLEIGISPAALNGIFEEEEERSLSIQAYNNSSKPRETEIGFDVTDFFDHPRMLPKISFTVEANSHLEKKIPLPQDWKGFFRVKAKEDPSHALLAKTLPLAIVPRLETSNSFLGVNHAYATSHLIQLAKKAGVTWYRDWTLKWDHIEPEPGKYNWQMGDTQINRVLDEKVNLMVLLPPFPSTEWNSEAPPVKAFDGYNSRSRLRQAWAPKEPELLGEFIGKAVHRYHDKIKYWEFLNEPNHATYVLPIANSPQHEKYPAGKRYTADDYVNLLKMASAAMKKEDPDCKVIGGSSGPPHLEVTEDIIKAGAAKYVDIVNLHVYPRKRPPEFFIPYMDGVLKNLDQNGGRKPIWITEFAYYAMDDLPTEPYSPAPNMAEREMRASEKDAAAETIRFMSIMLARDVEKIFLHAGANAPVNDSNIESNLFAEGGTPRKFFPVLAHFVKLMGEKPAFTAEACLDNEVYFFGFETGKEACVVAWATTPQEKKLEISTHVKKCEDIVGNTVQNIVLGPSPVFLIGNSGDSKEIIGFFKTRR